MLKHQPSILSFGAALLALFFLVGLSPLSPTITGAEAKSRNIIDIYNPAVFDYGVLRNRKPVIVFFASKKCTLCSRTLTKLEAMAQDQYSEDLYLARVDMDKFPDLMEKLGVSQTPTVRVYMKGVQTDEVRGLKMPAIMEIFDRVARTSRASQRFKNRYQG